MDSFKDMVKKKPNNSLPKMSGTFVCQQCGEFVYEGTYDRAKSKLSWACSLGHPSSIDWEL